MAYQQHPPLPGPNSGSGPGGLLYMNSPYVDTTLTKVFVGGLAWETQSEILRQHFEQFGEILEAVVITDKNTGRSKGYGFVSIISLSFPWIIIFIIEVCRICFVWLLDLYKVCNIHASKYFISPMRDSVINVLCNKWNGWQFNDWGNDVCMEYLGDFLGPRVS